MNKRGKDRKKSERERRDTGRRRHREMGRDRGTQRETRKQRNTGRHRHIERAE